MNIVRQLIVFTLIISINFMSLSLPAQAALVGVDALVAAQSRQDAEHTIRTALARDDVSGALQRMGVRSDEVKRRIAALSDDDVNTLAQRIDSLPAGGDFFATVGIIFVILLITDILGFTKIFPFTRAQR